MDSEKFVKLCKTVVKDYVNTRLEKTDDEQLTEADIYIVRQSKVLQNSKAMVSTNLPDGMYYELTYNGDKKEVYLDAYKKWENIAIYVEG